MALQIIDHKRIEMTNDEYTMYESICKSYDDPKVNRSGKDLFQDHFQVNDKGIIIFVKPPSKKYTSLEVFCFLLSLMQNQHLRIIQEQNQIMIKETETKINSLIGEVNSIKNQLAESLSKTS